MGLFDRLKIWEFEETVKSDDLNGEIDNVIDNMKPASIDPYSTNVAQMQVQTNPGNVNSENLAPSLAGELERLRFAIARMIGLPLWYQSPALSLQDVQGTLSSAVGLPRNRIVSGSTVPGTTQPGFVKSAGSSAQVTIVASTLEPLVCFINGQQYTFTSNINFNNLSLAPSANNTATVNDATMSGQNWTKLAGEDKHKLLVSSAGSEITSIVGQAAAFLNPNAGNELFVADIDPGGFLKNAYRGFFFDSSRVPIIRDVLNNLDQVKLCRMTWVFLTTDGTIDVSYHPPVYSGVAPSSPSVGDYWFDQSTETWMKFSSSGFANANAILAGYCVQDTANCIAARAVDFYNVSSEDNTMLMVLRTSASVATQSTDNYISVYGKKFQWQRSQVIWNYPSNLDTGVSSSISTPYFFYISDTGKPVISDQYPHNRLKDLRGWYHPHQPWRCVGGTFRDASGNFSSDQIISFALMKDSDTIGEVKGVMQAYDPTDPVHGYVVAQYGTTFTEVRRDLYFRLFAKVRFASGDGDGIDTVTLLNGQGTFMRGTDVTPVQDPDSGTRGAQASGGNTAGNVGSVQGSLFSSHKHGGGDHTHTSRYRNGMTTVQSGGGAQGLWFTFPASSSNDSFTGTTNSGEVIGAEGGAENRPINFYATIFLKY